MESDKGAPGRLSTQGACDSPQGRSGDELFDELATLCLIEQLLRQYINDYYKPHTAKHDRPFAPGTVRLVEAVEPLLEHLDAGRSTLAVTGEPDPSGQL
jgi:hypothetical protein